MLRLFHVFIDLIKINRDDSYSNNDNNNNSSRKLLLILFSMATIDTISYSFYLNNEYYY